MIKKLLAILGLIGIGVTGRLMPHAPNATPITAITLAAQRHVGRTWSFVIPMAAMVISDLLIGFYDWKIMAGVYGSFLVISFFSRYSTTSSNILSSVLFATTASVFFFLVTNFAVWATSPWFEKSISGLLYCYTLGIPFLRNMLLGDAIYTFVILGMFQLAPLLLRSLLPQILPTIRSVIAARHPRYGSMS